MPKLRHAAGFLHAMLDWGSSSSSSSSAASSSSFKGPLLFVPGSLFIDVFIRNNYTTDSNAMYVGFLRDFAEAEEAVGNATGADDLRSLADGVSDAVSRLLWSGSYDSAVPGADHFITQLNRAPDTGGVASAGDTESGAIIRDFVDYDANLIVSVS
jgi:hypothetical protein